MAQDDVNDHPALNIAKENEAGDRLAGAVFVVEGSDEQFTTGENGKVCITELNGQFLEDRPYLVTEVTPPPGYALPSEPSQMVEPDNDWDWPLRFARCSLRSPDSIGDADAKPDADANVKPDADANADADAARERGGRHPDAVANPDGDPARERAGWVPTPTPGPAGYGPGSARPGIERRPDRRTRSQCCWRRD